MLPRASFSPAALVAATLALGIGLVPGALLHAQTAESPAAETTEPIPDDAASAATDDVAPVAEVVAEVVVAPDADSPGDWMTRFGLTVLREMAQDTSQARLVSPLGLATVMAMLADGAQGATAQGYAQGLGLPADAALDAVAAQWRALADPGDGFVLQGASGLWLAPDFDAQAAYIARQQAALGAEVASVDFADPAVLEQINGWFAERTGGMIPELLADLDPQTRIVLGNALYLNARWQTAFDPELTLPAMFTSAAGIETEVQLMRQEDQFLYRQAADHQAVVLPFADPDFALTLYLPSPGTAPEALLAPGAALHDATGFRPHRGVVELPWLDLNVGGERTGILRDTGMLEGSDHAGLTAEPLAIAMVIQKIALRLDEVGAEAAAATAATGVRSAQVTSFHLRADRPFALAITHLPSNTPLFLGVINTL